MQIGSFCIFFYCKVVLMLEGHEFISVFYCQVFPSLNKVFVVVEELPYTEHYGPIYYCLLY